MSLTPTRRSMNIFHIYLLQTLKRCFKRPKLFNEIGAGLPHYLPKLSKLSPVKANLGIMRHTLKQDFLFFMKCDTGS